MLSASQSSVSGSEPQSSLGGSSRNAAARVHNPRARGLSPAGLRLGLAGRVLWLPMVASLARIDVLHLGPPRIGR
jgi:hypothetical protein